MRLAKLCGPLGQSSVAVAEHKARPPDAWGFRPCGRPASGNHRPLAPREGDGLPTQLCQRCPKLLLTSVPS